VSSLTTQHVSKTLKKFNQPNSNTWIKESTFWFEVIITWTVKDDIEVVV
jgi:hypothetical protein